MLHHKGHQQQTEKIEKPQRHLRPRRPSKVIQGQDKTGRLPRDRW